MSNETAIESLEHYQEFYEEDELTERRQDEQGNAVNVLPRRPQLIANKLSTLHIEHTISLPEYPTTHIEGYTYCIDIRGIPHLPDSIDEGKKGQIPEEITGNMAYTNKRTYGPKNTECLYLGVKAKRMTKLCTGIQHCEYISPDIRNHVHTEVNEAEWEWLQTARPEPGPSGDPRETNANSLYHAVHNMFLKKQACRPQLDSCTPTFCQASFPDLAGNYTASIECVNFNWQSNKTHMHKGLPYNGIYSIPYLRTRFETPWQPPPRECTVFEGNWTRRQYCGTDHPQGPGHMVNKPCDVQFTWICPLNLKETPYVLLTSHGTHNHPFPPPNKPPGEIVKDVWQLILRIRDPMLTTAKFLVHPLFKEWKELKGVQSLADVHNAFNTSDRIAAMIRKMRTYWWPLGRDINTVVFLKETTEGQPNAYVRDIHFDDNNKWIIVCMLADQAKIWSSLRAFEVDLTHKRLKDHDSNEILFTIEGRHGHVITLCRAYTNYRGDAMWRRLFHCVFNVLARLLGQASVLWAHLTPEYNVLEGPVAGFHCVKMDQSGEQYSGLGQYLQDVDDQHRPPIFHLKHVLMLCRVHFYRKIREKFGDHAGSFYLRQRMMALIDVHSIEDYMSIIQELKASDNLLVRGWAKNKQNETIASSICVAYSSMDIRVWRSERADTNSNEQSGWKSQSLGKSLDLPMAIQTGLDCDQRDMNQWEGWTKFGTWTGQRDNSMRVRQERMIRRELSSREKAATKRRRSQYSDDEDMLPYQDARLDVPLDVQSHVGSQRSTGSQRSRGSTQSRTSSRTPSRTPSRTASRTASRTPSLATLVPSSQEMPPPPLPNRISTPVRLTVHEQQAQLAIERERAQIIALQQENELKALQIAKFRRDEGL